MPSPSRAPGYPGARRAVKALLKVGYGCNEHCAFCHTLDVREVQGSAEEVEAKIRRAAELAAYQLRPGERAMVVLSGGEPTIRPELVRWAELIASLDMDVGLVTNGRMLAYPELTRALLARRLRYVYLSLHGGSARVHNLMVRTQAFDEAFAALQNLAGRGLDLHINCVVTRHNLAHLRGLVDAVLPFPDATLKFSMVEPKGGGDRLFDHLMPRVADVAARVTEAIAHGEAKVGQSGQAGPRFEHGALPLCLMPGRERQFGDLKTHGYRTMIEVGEPDWFPVDDFNKVHPAACDGCRHRGACPGLYRGYHEVHGDAELRPVAGPRANAFNYTLRGLVPVPADMSEDHCPLRDGPLGVTPWDRGRDLFVRHNGKLGHYHADTRDFSDVEIAASKHALGQVYLDASRKPAPDDFASDLVPLARARVCAGCPSYASCSGLFEPVLEDIFTRDDAEVRRHLSALRGELLDLGCGEAPYADALAPALAAGQLRYLGLDPDPARLAALRLPGTAELIAGTTSTANAELGARQFDHLTILRSWNHLPDPAADLTLLLPRLRRGGSLMVVDNLVFGLARTAAQSERGERSTAGWEHYRSDDATQAGRCILGVATSLDRRLTLLARHDVAPGTSNQWMLHYRVD
ncbi:MAG: radical SAM protein [Nannocystis sp.]|nr:radical SAM protein [Nannocystis sp.]MBA3549963.1 radical SAM protein [Nannocystis sp.]